MRAPLVVMLPLLVGCASDPAGGVDAGATDTGSADAVVIEDAGAPTFENVQTIFDQSCLFSSCHGPRASGMLNLSPGMSHAQLVGVASSEVPRLQRVRSGDPARSWLMMKLENTHQMQPECAANRTVCGTSMPQSDELLTPGRRALIRQWIAMGAPGPRDR